jgi:branched-chain amino acid transport system permease protein
VKGEGEAVLYRVDADHDRQYIEEFRRKPIGAHSPGLMRLLTAMRFDPSGRQVILVCRKPFAEWVIGEMPPSRSDPIAIEDGPVFTSREEAEWEVFRRRWRRLTGEAIDTPFRD